MPFKSHDDKRRHDGKGDEGGGTPLTEVKKLPPAARVGDDSQEEQEEEEEFSDSQEEQEEDEEASPGDLKAKLLRPAVNGVEALPAPDPYADLFAECVIAPVHERYQRLDTKNWLGHNLFWSGWWGVNGFWYMLCTRIVAMLIVYIAITAIFGGLADDYGHEERAQFFFLVEFFGMWGARLVISWSSRIINGSLTWVLGSNSFLAIVRLFSSFKSLRFVREPKAWYVWAFLLFAPIASSVPFYFLADFSPDDDSSSAGLLLASSSDTGGKSAWSSFVQSLESPFVAAGSQWPLMLNACVDLVEHPEIYTLWIFVRYAWLALWSKQNELQSSASGDFLDFTKYLEAWRWCIHKMRLDYQDNPTQLKDRLAPLETAFASNDDTNIKAAFRTLWEQYAPDSSDEEVAQARDWKVLFRSTTAIALLVAALLLEIAVWTMVEAADGAGGEWLALAIFVTLIAASPWMPVALIIASGIAAAGSLWPTLYQDSLLGALEIMTEVNETLGGLVAILVMVAAMLNVYFAWRVGSGKWRMWRDLLFGGPGRARFGRDMPPAWYGGGFSRTCFVSIAIFLLLCAIFSYSAMSILMLEYYGEHTASRRVLFWIIIVGCIQVNSHGVFMVTGLPVQFCAFWWAVWFDEDKARLLVLLSGMDEALDNLSSLTQEELALCVKSYQLAEKAAGRPNFVTKTTGNSKMASFLNTLLKKVAQGIQQEMQRHGTHAALKKSERNFVRASAALHSHFTNALGLATYASAFADLTQKYALVEEEIDEEKALLKKGVAGSRGSNTSYSTASTYPSSAFSTSSLGLPGSYGSVNG